MLYTLHFHPGYDAPTILAEHQRWESAHTRGLSGIFTSHTNEPSPDRRLRVGYLSADFCDHAVGRTALMLLRGHDHAAFEIVCLSSGRKEDAFTAETKSLSDGWHDVAPLSDEALANFIRENRIDILVDTTLHMARGRPLTMARRPAPIQVNFLGYQATSGLRAINYRLTDAHLDPPGESESHNAETLLRLKTFWCYFPDESAPPASELPALKSGYVTFGSLNNPGKVSAAVIELWANVLHAVPASRLMLLVQDRAGRNQYLIGQFARHGIGSDRITLVSRCHRDAYLRLYHQIDIALDPFPHGAHVTACDGLWMGVPMITLRGQTSVGRGGASLLSNLGLPEWIAQTQDQYVSLASAAANELDRLIQLRQTLRNRLRSSILCDASTFAGDVETQYRLMWQRWCERQR